MGIYDEFFGTIKDKVIDDATDSLIGRVKSRASLENTFVWTVINRETHGGVTANFIFINKNMKRRRVAYNDLETFCDNFYVSNVMIENGNVKLIGCTLYDLPNFKLQPNGQYSLSAVKDEQYIYNRAMPYIQSQERKIIEDYNNGCLKSQEMGDSTCSDNSGYSLGSISGDLSSIKGIANATAVTAVTVAGVAAVAGVGKAGKAVYNHINKKGIEKIQLDLCARLVKLDDMIETLIRMKKETNKNIENNLNFTDYTNAYEASFEYSNTLKNEVMQYGVIGCIQKADGLLNKIQSKAIADGAIDMRINNKSISGITFGTLKDHISHIQSRIVYLGQQHEITKQMINSHIQLIRSIKQSELQQMEQNNLVLNLKNEIEQLESSIMHRDNCKESVLNKVNTLYTKLEQVLETDKQEQLKSRLFIIRDTVDTEIRFRSRNNKEQLLNKLNEVEIRITELRQGKYTREEYLTLVIRLNDTLQECENNIDSLLQQDKEYVVTRVENLRLHLTDKDKSIVNGIAKGEKDFNAINKLNSIIEDAERDLSRVETSKSASNLFEDYKRKINIALNNINNPEKLTEYTEKINNIKTMFIESIDNLKNEEENERNRIDDIGRALIEHIVNETNRITNLENNEENLLYIKEFRDNGDLDVIKGKITENIYDTNLKRTLNDKLRALENICRRKISDIENMIFKETRAIAMLNSKLSSIEARINTLNRYNKDSVYRDITSIRASDNFIKVREHAIINEHINEKIDNLLSMYNIKIAEL